MSRFDEPLPVPVVIIVAGAAVPRIGVGGLVGNGKTLLVAAVPRPVRRDPARGDE